MDKFVVDFKTSEELEEHLPEEYRSKFYWFVDRNGYQRLTDYLSIPHKRITQVAGYEYTTIPALILDEILDLLPKVSAEKDFREENGELIKKVLDFHWVMTGLGNDVEYINYPGYNKLDWLSYKGFDSFGAHDVNKATACAQLYLWLVNSKYNKDK